MDLGIRGRTAIVCGSSRGLGRACADALAAEGVNVVLNGIDLPRLRTTADELSERYPGCVKLVAADITTDEGQRALLGICPDPDILVNNNAGPPPGAFLSFDQADWEKATTANMIAPIMLTRAVLPMMKERHFGRVINITSAMVTTPRPHMALSAGPRAGLTAVMKAISLDVARHNVTINNLLPERFDTDRQVYMAKETAKRESISYEEARSRQVQSIAARRLGIPAEFGAMCAFLCSAHAGFVSGQNIHLDGGSYPALL